MKRITHSLLGAIVVASIEVLVFVVFGGRISHYSFIISLAIFGGIVGGIVGYFFKLT